MYTQPAFRMDEDSDMAAFIEARQFATLSVSGDDGPLAAHVPMILLRDAAGRVTALEGHVGKGNPVAAQTPSNGKALAIFNGADAYVTPSLYLSKREHGRVVPTWNYIAVQVRGRLETFSGEALRSHVEALTSMMESDAAVPWAVSDAPEDYLAKMLNAIIGVRLTVESIEGARKLNQNRSEADRTGVQLGFSHSPHASARDLAAEMSAEFSKEA
ncbi:MAG: FMN-binding negative transcriptional regulator [Alphaproteobacteria bacterium]